MRSGLRRGRCSRLCFRGRAIKARASRRGRGSWRAGDLHRDTVAQFQLTCRHHQIAILKAADDLGLSVAPLADLDLGSLRLAIDDAVDLSLIHISEPTRRTPISYAVFCLKK